MIPVAPPGYHPSAPARNPQLTHALPGVTGGVPGTTRHRTAVIVLADTPFANTDAVGANGALDLTVYPSGSETTVRGPLMTFRHYNGTLFYFTTDELFGADPGPQVEPWAHNHYSASFDHWEDFPGGVGTAERAARFMAGILQLREELIRTGELHNGQPVTKANWPWKCRAEEIDIEGVPRWCLVVEDDYPAGTGAVSWTAPIVTIPDIGANTQTQALIGYRAIYEFTGTAGYCMVPGPAAPFKFLPAALEPAGGATTIVPFEIGNVS